MATTYVWFDSSVSGSCTAATNAVGPLDSVFTADEGNTSWTHLWRLARPTGIEFTLENSSVQTITLRVRKATGTGNPTITQVRLLKNNVDPPLAVANTGWTVTSSSGESINVNLTVSGGPYTITPSDLLSIEVTTVAAGGAPAARAAVQLDSGQTLLDYTPSIADTTFAAAPWARADVVADINAFWSPVSTHQLASSTTTNSAISLTLTNVPVGSLVAGAFATSNEDSQSQFAIASSPQSQGFAQWKTENGPYANHNGVFLFKATASTVVITMTMELVAEQVQATLEARALLEAPASAPNTSTVDGASPEFGNSGASGVNVDLFLPDSNPSQNPVYYVTQGCDAAGNLTWGPNQDSIISRPVWNSGMGAGKRISGSGSHTVGFNIFELFQTYELYGATFTLSGGANTTFAASPAASASASAALTAHAARSTSETATATDTQTAGAVYAASLSETAPATEAQGADKFATGAVTESAAPSDSSAASAVFANATSEAATSSSTEAATQIAAAATSETATAADSTTGAVGALQESLSETATATDSTSPGVQTHVAALTESAAATDAAATQQTHSASWSDAAIAVDAEAALAIHVAALTEAAAAADSSDGTVATSAPTLTALLAINVGVTTAQPRISYS